jgi:hypothetical protein
MSTMMTNAQPRSASTEESGTAALTRAWQALRDRYREVLDLFTARELAHLRFLRWLVRTGRLDE